MRKTCDKYYRLPVNDICVLAHKDPPYLGAEMGKKIDFNFVVYREKDEVEVPFSEERSYKGTISDEAGKKLLAYVGGNS